MSAAQLALFPYRKPLLELFGRQFFKNIPACPGVYWFSSDTGRVLYVGQSKDLRARLRYYKNARPEREPRRILRLIVRVRSILWETCPSAEEAQLRELKLIQQHRPTYNRSNNLSAIYPFFILENSGNHILLRLADDPLPAPGARAFGAFKGRGSCRRVLLGLGRLFWASENPDRTVWDLPIHLGELSKSIEVPLSFSTGDTHQLLPAYFDGSRNELADIFAAVVSAIRDLHLKAILENDLLTVTEFFDTGPRNNRKLAAEYGLNGLILKEQVDELRLRSRPRSTIESAATTHENRT